MKAQWRRLRIDAVTETTLPSHIFLVGFMGSGKTTVGQALAEEIGCGFFDLDRIIESQEGKTIRRIFTEDGEREFRRKETEALNGLSCTSRGVVALGGGTYVSEANRLLLRKLGVTIWLECPLHVCLSRISGDVRRPLLRSESEMSALLDERIPAYREADLVVQTASATPDEIASRIRALLKRFLFNRLSSRQSENDE